jgi:hypothetical protein
MKLNERIQSSAVAAAVAIACGSGIIGVANAASFATAAGSTVTLSRQFVELASTTATIGVAATVTLGVAYASGDRIRIAVSNAQFATSGLATPTNAGGASFCTVDALSYADGTIANFRVPASGSAINSVCVFNLAVRTSTISQSAATGLTFSSFISGTSESLETAISRNFVTTASQFGAAVTKTLAGVVDVEKDRYHFTGDDPTSGGIITGGFDSQLVVSVTNAVAGLSQTARVSAVTVSLTGDFSWLDDDGSNSCSASDVTNGVAVAAFSQNAGPNSANVWSLSGVTGNCQTLSFVQSAGADGASLTSGAITIAVGKNVSSTSALATNSLGTIEKRIPAPQGYLVGVSFSYFNPDRGTATIGSVTPVAADTSAGSFTLNGSAVNVPFLPYGTGLSRIVYLTNRSAQTGSISFSAIADGESTACTSFASGTAKANGVTFLTQLIDDGITACYGANFGGKVAVTITSNTPAASTEVFSGYNRNGSITSVVNSSNGK